ncbi:MAG: HAD family hydrolase [Micromonosporaceae bacterium]
MPTPSPRPVDAVLFDFHGTLAQSEPAERRVSLAAAACGVLLDIPRLMRLAVAVRDAGLAGGFGCPPSVPASVVRAWENRDLSAEDHRAAYVGIADTVHSGIAGLSEAMYDRLVDPDGWVAYPDAVPTLQALRDRGIPTALVSNIGFDVRPVAKQLGFADLIDTWVLSYEVGVCKPDPTIFRHACAQLGVSPQRSLMVGDTAADAGAGAAGCTVLVLPASPPGALHGLGGVVRLV